MCERLPDRTESLAAEDIFGRRRGDIILKGESMMEAGGKPLFACDTPPQRDPTPSPCEEDMKGYLKHLNGPSEMNRVNGRDELVSIQDEEEETMKNIEKAIDSSKGRLRNSANMSKAFKAVIKSGEGLVRKSELIQATLNSDESKDPSMIILLDPESCDPSNPHLEGVSTTSEESCSVEAMQNVGIVANRSMGFSTSMTAKQCAATLETILREMACKVSRYEEEEYGARHLIRLKASRQANSGRVVERKIRIMVTIREEDRIRTSVAFRRIAGIYSSRDSHIPLCADIRDRFQREWPAVVEALYIRLPGVPKAHLSM